MAVVIAALLPVFLLIALGFDRDRAGRVKSSTSPFGRGEEKHFLTG